MYLCAGDGLRGDRRGSREGVRCAPRFTGFGGLYIQTRCR